MIVARDDVERLLVQLRREIDQVLVAQTLDIDRRRPRRKRLGFSGTFAGNTGGRDRTLLDRPNWLAGQTIEDVNEGLLGDLRHRLDAASVDGDVDQIGRCRRVVVPQAMVDELVVPYLPAGRRVEAHQAVTIETVSGRCPP